jgi:hypothetical protein
MWADLEVILEATPKHLAELPFVQRDHAIKAPDFAPSIM